MWILWIVLAWIVLSMPLAILFARMMKRSSEALDEWEPREARPVIMPREAEKVFSSKVQ